MEKLVIIDYSDISVHIYDIASGTDIDEEYIHNLGYNPGNCSWMFGENMEIIYHKEILR